MDGLSEYRAKRTVSELSCMINGSMEFVESRYLQIVAERQAMMAMTQ